VTNAPIQPRPPAAADGNNTRDHNREPAPRIGTIGIAGGGQLARMLVDAAARLGLRTVVLDPDAQCSASSCADEFLVGEFASPTALSQLARATDALTFEIERVDAAVLEQLERDGFAVNPSSRVLATIQDKLVQKRFLESIGIPTPAFAPYNAHEEISRTPPFVWKARRGGYDGRGVAVIRSLDELAAVPQVPAMTEDLVDIKREFAIIIARDGAGQLQYYPLTDIHMDPDAHVLDTVVAPAEVNDDVVAICRDYACRIAEALDYVGVLAIELFLDGSDVVSVNELSPRPHNSGHYSIEACVTSQFEQHLRAVAGLPLGPTDLKVAAACFNLLGPADPAGVAALARRGDLGPDVFVHDYAKIPIRPGRKVGHVTVTASTPAEAAQRAAAVKRIIATEYGQ
jgi:5-(carboxyamino)imidazole ribonucleotide synthase